MIKSFLRPNKKHFPTSIEIMASSNVLDIFFLRKKRRVAVSINNMCTKLHQKNCNLKFKQSMKSCLAHQE